MSSDAWISKNPCPTCGGQIRCWYAFDDYGPSGGYNCTTDRNHKISYNMAYPEAEGRIFKDDPRYPSQSVVNIHLIRPKN